MRSATREAQLRNKDNELAKAVPALTEQLDQIISQIVAPYIEQYVRAAHLEQATPQFHKDVARTIRACLVEQIYGPTRKRYSDIRKEMQRVSKAAAEMAKALNEWLSALDALTLTYRELLEPVLPKVTADPPALFNAFVQNVRRVSEQIKTADKGGRPRMFAFEYLVRGLARAYEHAAGQPPALSYRADKSDDGKPIYESALIDLVEDILPLVRQLAGEKPLFRFPDTAEVRAKYIYETIRPGGPKSKRSSPKP